MGTKNNGEPMGNGISWGGEWTEDKEEIKEISDFLIALNSHEYLT